jgi:hypothetical protein
MCSEKSKEILEWVCKHNLVVLPAMHRSELCCVLGRWDFRLCRDCRCTGQREGN